MAQSLVKIVTHVVYSTKNRSPLLSESTRKMLLPYTIGILTKIDCGMLAMGGTEDHIHLLIAQSKNISVSKLIEEVKTGTSRWLKKQDANFVDFSWQGGYGAFSVSESQISKVQSYIGAQEQHHCKCSFQEELRTLLKRHGIPFDEKYLWQ